MTCTAHYLVFCGLLACNSAHVVEPRPILDDTVLLSHLPAGNALVLGGSFRAIQRLLERSLARSAPQLARELAKWTSCFPNIDHTRVISGLAFDRGNIVVRGVISGLTLEDYARCANEARFPAYLDVDGKYLSIEMTVAGQSAMSGYLALPDGTIYTRSRFGIATSPNAGAKRYWLERDVAATASQSVRSDTAAFQLTQQADHRMPIWFAGSGNGTPFAETVGDFYGGLDVIAGVHLEATVTLLNSAVADKLVDSFAKLHDESRDLGSEFVELLAGVELQRTENRFHLTIQWSDAQIAAVFGRLELITYPEIVKELCACKDPTCARPLESQLEESNADIARLNLTPKDREVLRDAQNALATCRGSKSTPH